MKTENDYFFSSAIIVIVVAGILNFYSSPYIMEYSSLNLYNVKGILLITIAVVIALLFSIKYYKCNIENVVHEGVKSNSVYLSILIVLSLIVFFYKLDAIPNFNNDEHSVIESAYSFMKSGKFEMWDFYRNIGVEEYSRAWPHSFLLSLIFRFFGISIFTARGLSAIFGVFNIISCYYVFSKLTKNNEKAFLVAIILLFNPFMIEIFRTVRMYALAIPFSIWLFYFGYKALNTPCNEKYINGISKLYKKFFNFNFKYVCLALFTSVIVYLLMPNSLFMSIGFLLFVIYKSIIDKEERFFSLSKVIVFLLVFLIISVIGYKYNIGFFSYVASLVFHLGILIQPNYIYLFTNIMFPCGMFVGIVLITLSFSRIIINRKQNVDNVRVLCFLIWISSLILFIFFANRYYQYRYMAYLTIFTSYLIVDGVDSLYGYIKTGAYKSVQIILIIASVLSVVTYYPLIYDNARGTANFETAYKVIKEDAKKEGVSIIPFYSYQNRHFYTQNLEPINYLEMENYKNHIRYASDERYEFNDFVDEVYPLIAFAKDNPIGYISFEKEKYNYKSPIMEEFLLNCTNKITGDELDESNVETYKYIWIHPKVTQGEKNDGKNNKGHLLIDTSQMQNLYFISLRVDSSYNNSVNLLLDIPEKQGLYDYDLSIFFKDCDECLISEKVYQYTKDNQLLLGSIDNM